MRAIVLVKQVPDLRGAPVGIRPDGTIDREGTRAITNPADLHAVEAALQLADEVWAVSMGPRQAADALREVLALGATRAVLLSDRVLAGSDTWATANALTAVIERLGGADLIFCGASALDGETGQVGPQVAVRLGLPQATGCESIAIEDGRVIARRIVEGGFERLSLPVPALMTVAETGFAPRYPTLSGRRRAAAATIEQWSAADVGIDASKVGLEASPTKVAHMQPTPLPDRQCRFVGVDGFDYDQLVRALADLGVFAVTGAPESRPASAGRSEVPTVDGGEARLWVVCELLSGAIAPVSTELISKAAELAPLVGVGVTAVVLGHEVQWAVEEVARFGADVALVADDPALSRYRTEPYARVLSELVRARRPTIILVGATTTGRDLAPRVAALLDTGLAADCTDLKIAPWQRGGVHYEALLHQIRPAMAGGVLATCVCPVARPQMATVRPGVFAARPAPRPPRSERLEVNLEAGDLRVEVLDRQIGTADVGLADADIVIAGGAGCGTGNWHLIEALAETMGGRVAASRSAVEAGLAPRSLQVGQTGATVHPQLYVACGISGALQHTVGMRNSRTVVAINRDPNAFIFRLANFGIIGDVAVVLPKLVAALQQLGHGQPR